MAHRRSRHAAIAGFAGCIALFQCDGSQAAVVVTIIGGTKAHADITLPVPLPGSGNYTAEFELEFEGPHNLTVACLGLTADVLDATAIANINGRLPLNQSIDPAFPVRVTVEPPAGCGLQFYYDVKVDFDTPDLVFSPYSQYRLVKAPIGGVAPFHDLTTSVVSGSVRVRGTAGGFSEFVVTKDMAQDYATGATQGYAALEARLGDSAIGLTAQLTLMTDLDISRAAFEAGNYAQAISHLNDLDYHCSLLGGPALPNTWRSARDLVNAEGEVVGYTGNIRFALGRLSGLP
ncbi:MAG: DUF6689 family protein [Dokdonella sp.]